MGSLRVWSVVALILACCLRYFAGNFDIMTGLSEDVDLGYFATQLTMSAFCLIPGNVEKFNIKLADDHWDPTKAGNNSRDFKETGEIREDEYTKQSIYALLYAMYRNVGTVRHTDGSLYNFTFNTWGISNVDDRPFGPKEPQRHGMAQYYTLAQMDKVKELVAQKPDLTMVEIGCGTGAGANLITREVYKTIKYKAIDMQKAGIEACNRLHATPDNPNLECVHSNGKSLPLADGSADVVIISETHIAEAEIGEEEKKIFAEIVRVLKPGGLFIWGNALPTKVWLDAYPYLEANGWSSCGKINHTQRAIVARDEDADRVSLFLKQALDIFPVFSIPSIGPQCRNTIEMLYLNFCRQPGTDLYQRMVVGEDSYMHLCYSLDAKQKTR